VTRLRAYKIFATALLALTLIAPTGASAAVPVLTTTFTALPSTGVQDGELVAFRATIKNDDSSTVSQLFLVELTRDPNLTLVSVTPSQGTCDKTTDPGHFKCTLGQLKPNRPAAKVTAVYTTAVVTAPVTAYTATGNWEFNTTGLGSGSDDNSHGDRWGGSFSVGVTSDDDLGGRFITNPNLLIVENNQALNNANPHSTRAFAPVTGIGVSVEDINCTVTDPPTTLDPLCTTLSAGFGEISKVNVNEDVDDSGITATTLLHFYIQLDSSEIPQGTNANSVNIQHVYPGGSETISTRCTFDRKQTTPNNAACITVKNLPGGDLGIDIWSLHNGGFKPING
jgi:uncharacterized protein DUF11